MDYRDLLMKYIAHIGTQESITYLNAERRPASLFTDQEWDELQNLEEESRKYDRIANQG